MLKNDTFLKPYDVARKHVENHTAPPRFTALEAGLICGLTSGLSISLFSAIAGLDHYHGFAWYVPALFFAVPYAIYWSENKTFDELVEKEVRRLQEAESKERLADSKASERHRPTFSD